MGEIIFISDVISRCAVWPHLRMLYMQLTTLLCCVAFIHPLSFTLIQVFICVRLALHVFQPYLLRCRSSWEACKLHAGDLTRVDNTSFCHLRQIHQNQQANRAVYTLHESQQIIQGKAVCHTWAMMETRNQRWEIEMQDAFFFAVTVENHDFIMLNMPVSKTDTLVSIYCRNF